MSGSMEGTPRGTQVHGPFLSQCSTMCGSMHSFCTRRTPCAGRQGQSQFVHVRYSQPVKVWDCHQCSKGPKLHCSHDRRGEPAG